MLVPLLGIIMGVLLGIILPLNISPAWSAYVAIGIMAALHSIFGGMRATIEGVFHTDLFITGFIGNTVLAIGLTFAGDHLDVPLYLVAIFAFGTRMFENLAVLRRALLTKARDHWAIQQQRRDV